MSADRDVATVDQTGLVTAVGAGDCMITVHSNDDGNLYSSLDITVSINSEQPGEDDSGSGDAVEYGLEIVEESGSDRELSIGHTNRFKVSKTPRGYKDIENVYRVITAESSNEAVIKITEVDTDGFNVSGFGTTIHTVSIEAVSAGNATITFSLIGLNDDVLATMQVDYTVVE